MFRNYDWECPACGYYFERMVKYDQGDPAPVLLGDVEDLDTTCPNCGEDAIAAERLISLIAEVHCDKDLSPQVAGGKFDTMGQRQVPRPKDVGFLPDHASYEEARTHVSRPEFKEWKAERNAVRKENKVKRTRLAAKRRGENVNFRKDKLPGDPSMTA